MEKFNIVPNFPINEFEGKESTNSKTMLIINQGKDSDLILGFDESSQTLEMVYSMETYSSLPAKNDLPLYPYSKLVIVKKDNKAILVPEEFANANPETMEKVAFYYTGKNESNMSFFSVPNTDVKILQSNSYTDEMLAEIGYESAKLMTSTQGWLAYHIENYKDISSPSVHICFDEEGFSFTGFKNNQLRIYNYFKENEENNVLYYIHFACEQSEIQPSEAICYFSGVGNEPLQEEISNAFLASFVQELPMRFSYPKEIYSFSGELFPYIINICGL